VRPPSGAGPLAALYFLYFAAVGVALPFLPAWFRSLGFSGREIGLLLALQPAFALLAPPLWGRLADRTGRPDRVLTLLAFGALACFGPLAFVDGYGPVLAAMACYALFVSSITTMLDSMAFAHVARAGGQYARLRLFGSLGFVVTSAAFGFAVREVDRTVVFAVLGLVAGYAVLSLAIRSERRPPPGPTSWGFSLLRDRDLAILLASACLHWIACAPFHGFFAVHVRALGLPPWVVGASASLGVLAEVAVMFGWSRFGAPFAPRHVLAASFLASAVRWVGLSFARAPELIVALNVLHALTFGAFFVASVGFLARRVPAQQRSTGQALFVSGAFGLGGLVGSLSSGIAYDALGGPGLFLAAAALELVPALLILRVRAPAEA
jgi:MFS transporter, PPP family, 3-phenylpropionic acid transporter